MKRIVILFVLLYAVISFSCVKEKGFPKPKNLVGTDQMVHMLYDIHLTEAYSNHYRFESDSLKKFNSKDLYFSVLEKYGIADSTFAKSIVYYSSMPKIYEKIYQRVIDRLSMLEEETKKPKEVNIQPEE